MDIPEEFHIYETEHWLLNHRVNSALPGYLILGAKADTDDISVLPEQALMSLGPLLAATQQTILSVLEPNRVYISRYGHDLGHSFHFHIIPIFNWVERLFWQDARYGSLAEFATPTGTQGTDGVELTFFVCREFCERLDPPEAIGPSVEESVIMLRNEMSKIPADE